jgi:excisionase family DNA binding protein
MEYITVKEAANLLNVTRQGIFAVIHKGRVNGVIKRNGKLLIPFDELDKYAKSRYDRNISSTINGVPIFQEERGTISVRDAAKLLGCDVQNLYYAIYKGHLFPAKCGNAFVLDKQKVIEYGQSAHFIENKNRRSA